MADSGQTTRSVEGLVAAAFIANNWSRIWWEYRSSHLILCGTLGWSTATFTFPLTGPPPPNHRTALYAFTRPKTATHAAAYLRSRPGLRRAEIISNRRTFRLTSQNDTPKTPTTSAN